MEYCILTCTLFTFAFKPGGDAKELYAVQGEGETTRTVRLLKTPEVCEGVSVDRFADQRPIIATVKKGR